MFQKLTEKEKGKKPPVVAVVGDVLENKMSEKKFKYTDEDIERLVSLYNEARKRRQRQEQQRTSSSSSSSSTNDEIKIEQLHNKRKNREKFKAKELSYMISIKTKRVNMYDFLKKFGKIISSFIGYCKNEYGF